LATPQGLRLKLSATERDWVARYNRNRDLATRERASTPDAAQDGRPMDDESEWHSTSAESVGLRGADDDAPLDAQDDAR